VKIKTIKGFSLLELMIVLAILGVAVTFATPAFNKYRHNANLKEAARDLTADVALIKQRAVSESIQYRIVFDESANNYRFQIEQPRDSGNYVDLAPASDNTKSPAAIGAITISNPSFTGGVPYITFQQRGTTSAGSVTLTNKISSTAVITTTLMGKVYVTFDMH
jgi:type IV pilus assembly protein PilE